jgi:uncharacterized membrane protein YjgN (DUF898 family)
MTAMSQPPQPPYGPPTYYSQPDHPQATTVLALGILGLVLCQVLAPVAWVMGNRVVREIDESHGQWGGRSSANAGRICGIVGTLMMIGGFVVLVLLLVAGVVVSTGLSTS